MTKWTEAEDAILRKTAEEGGAYTDAAQVLGMTKGKVAGRAWRKGIIFRCPKGWRKDFSDLPESTQAAILETLERARKTLAIRRKVFG